MPRASGQGDTTEAFIAKTHFGHNRRTATVAEVGRGTEQQRVADGQARQAVSGILPGDKIDLAVLPADAAADVIKTVGTVGAKLLTLEGLTIDT